MSVERSFEAWEEVQRYGHDLADMLAQGFTGLIHSHISPPSFPWPNPPKAKLFDVEFPTQNFSKRDFSLPSYNPLISGVSSILNIGNRLGQAGADFGASLNGVVQQFFRRFPLPFRHDDNVEPPVRMELKSLGSDRGLTMQGVSNSLPHQIGDFEFAENEMVLDESEDEELLGINFRTAGLLGRPQVNL